jgi:hypothetical protein
VAEIRNIERLDGISICDNGFKLPLMYLLDQWLVRRLMTH